MWKLAGPGEKALLKILTVSVGQQQRVQRCLRPVRLVGSLSRLDFERHCESPFPKLVVHQDLDSSVDVTFQAIHGRPDMLLNVE